MVWIWMGDLLLWIKLSHKAPAETVMVTVTVTVAVTVAVIAITVVGEVLAVESASNVASQGILLGSVHLVVVVVEKVGIGMVAGKIGMVVVVVVTVAMALIVMGIVMGDATGIAVAVGGLVVTDTIAIVLVHMSALAQEVFDLDQVPWSLCSCYSERNGDCGPCYQMLQMTHALVSNLVDLLHCLPPPFPCLRLGQLAEISVDRLFCGVSDMVI